MGPETRRAKAKAASRDKALTSARALFEHHGYEAVTMRQIARDIGMSTGVLFCHFAGKADLFEAATGHPAPDVAAFLLRVVSTENPAHLSPTARIGLLNDLAVEAAELRRHLLGHHG